MRLLELSNTVEQVMSFQRTEAQTLDAIRPNNSGSSIESIFHQAHQLITQVMGKNLQILFQQNLSEASTTENKTPENDIPQENIRAFILAVRNDVYHLLPNLRPDTTPDQNQENEEPKGHTATKEYYELITMIPRIMDQLSSNFGVDDLGSFYSPREKELYEKIFHGTSRTTTKSKKKNIPNHPKHTPTPSKVVLPPPPSDAKMGSMDIHIPPMSLPSTNPPVKPAQEIPERKRSRLEILKRQLGW